MVEYKCLTSRNKCHASRNKCHASRNKCHASSNKCLTSSNKEASVTRNGMVMSCHGRDEFSTRGFLKRVAGTVEGTRMDHCVVHCEETPKSASNLIAFDGC